MILGDIHSYLQNEESKNQIINLLYKLLNIKLNGYLNLIPILNHSFILSDIFLNKINKVNILLTIISSIIYALVLIYIIVKQYKSEKILFDIS